MSAVIMTLITHLLISPGPSSSWEPLCVPPRFSHARGLGAGTALVSGAPCRVPGPQLTTPAAYRRSAPWRPPPAPAASSKSPPASPGGPPGSGWARWPSAPRLPPRRGNSAPGRGGSWSAREEHQILSAGSAPTHPCSNAKPAGARTAQWHLPSARDSGRSFPMKAFPRPGLRSCPAIAVARCRLQLGVPSGPSHRGVGGQLVPGNVGNPGGQGWPLVPTLLGMSLSIWITVLPSLGCKLQEGSSFVCLIYSCIPNT